MSEITEKNNRGVDADTTVARLFVLELNAGRIHSMNTDGTEHETIVTGCHLPDGIVVDTDAGHIYWTNMGVPNLNDGSIERADIDGTNRKTILPKGWTHTPKQIILDKKDRKLYWCDREGMRVMRCNLDGSQLETLIESGHGEVERQDQTRWCVGLTIDPKRGHIYWSQKGPDNAGRGRIFRANLEIPAGQTAANRTDIEVFFDGLPEPIDLELDTSNRVLYWTDRGDPPRGNTVNRASIDNKPAEPEIVISHLMEGIGIALDVEGDRMFVTDLAGSMYSARLDGSGEKNVLYAQGNLTGIAYAEIPKEK
ncbi:3-hydroxyacyl-CoA dehydrogenase [Dyella dinghuensis]|uniref:3-hydroxyacyl-CoA dehydrogenase n=1 Tax=Dyella dinghuensis TaxID=1920169 RepID=A0A432LW92_9GAMM|nr:3-hydroxyacyl-CoA dehydrogenase [Dyella dinghuensis]RUL66360.1 3-hydroxyacyl-CoA dehydrogenase [Dyella dinghuensis]